MLRTAVVLLFGVVALGAVAGCASSTSTAPSAAADPAAPPVNVAGTWTGSIGKRRTPVTLILEQTGAAVRGTVEVAGRADVSGPVEGTVVGNFINVQTVTATSWTLHVNDDKITGFAADRHGLPAAGTLSRLRALLAHPRQGQHVERTMTTPLPPTELDARGRLRAALAAVLVRDNAPELRLVGGWST